MRKIFISLCLLLSLALSMKAQEPKDIMKDPIPVAMFQATYAFHLPAFDNKALYSFSHNVGGGFAYKTASNWLFGVNANYIFGNHLNVDRVEIFGEGITTDVGEIVGGDGRYATLEVGQRGLHVQAQVGKVFAMGPNPNCGIFVQGGVGYLYNRIRVAYSQILQNPPHQVDHDYQYGYDRMRGGPALHLEGGYLYLSDTRLLNASLSLEVTYAPTHDLRDYDFRVFTNPETGVMEPVGRTDPHKIYHDFYYGIRFTWSIPTYQRKPADYYIY